MKKIISIFAAAAACVTLLAGCGSEEAPNELDMLIEQLQTTHLNTGSPEDSAEIEMANPYKSLTGAVISFNETGITVKSDGNEQKFVINEETQILGGIPSAAKSVTITYCEPEKKSKGIIANVITIIDSAEESVADTSDTSVSDSTSETDIITSESETSVPAEPGTETSAEPETEVSSDSLQEEQTITQTETQTNT